MTVRSGKEIEIKLRVTDRPRILRRLRQLRARPIGPRVFERNAIYDTKTVRLRKSGLLLRVRTESSPRKPRSHNPQSLPLPGLLTLKMPTQKSRRYKVREEKEWSTPDVRAVEKDLRRKGLSVVWRYEKYRTEFRLPRISGVLVALDETPIGDFLELEGHPRAIDRAAHALGFRVQDYLKHSYGALFFRQRKIPRAKRTHMTFPKNSAL